MVAVITEYLVNNFTFAPEIYILGEHHNDEHRTDPLSRESTMSGSVMSSQSWIKPMDGPSLLHPLFNRNHIQQISPVTPTFPKNLAKLREEQERLYLLQKELARKRHELESQNEKEKAAIKIQNAFRKYRHRNHIKQQQKAGDIEYEHLQKERRASTYENYAEENKIHDVVKISNRLQKLKAKRIELENNCAKIAHQLR
ncbi:unnamed protein product [Rotaria sp. Silwood2]|nr:unnamed protein product [Rotaria sp. Silwood2]